jgi:hypothetical protein
MDAIGEVLTSSITGLIAECWSGSEGEFELRSTNAPKFGSFLRIDATEADNTNIFAVVYDVVTGPQDSMHKPHALRLTREQLRMEQPQIFALLKTEIHATIIGYEYRSTYRPGLPPRPPQVHEFVYTAEPKEIKAITEDLDFVRLLARVTSVPTDELIAACIREAYYARKSDYDFLVRAGQTLAQTFREDYDRLSAMLRKIRPN